GRPGGAAPPRLRGRRPHPHRVPRHRDRPPARPLPGGRGAGLRGADGGAADRPGQPPPGRRRRRPGHPAHLVLLGRGGADLPDPRVHGRPDGVPVRPGPGRRPRRPRPDPGRGRGRHPGPGPAPQGAGAAGLRPPGGRRHGVPHPRPRPGPQPAHRPGGGGRGRGRWHGPGDRPDRGPGGRGPAADRPGGGHDRRGLPARGRRGLAGAGRQLRGLGRPRPPAGRRGDHRGRPGRPVPAGRGRGPPAPAVGAVTLREAFGDGFARRALLEAVMVGGLCGAVGVHVLLRRLPFFTMALGHATFPGVVLAGLLGISLFAGAAAFGAVVVVVVALLGTRDRVDDTSAVGVTLSGAFALGVLLLSAQAGFSRDLTAYLVGS